MVNLWSPSTMHTGTSCSISTSSRISSPLNSSSHSPPSSDPIFPFPPRSDLYPRITVESFNVKYLFEQILFNNNLLIAVPLDDISQLGQFYAPSATVAAKKGKAKVFPLLPILFLLHFILIGIGFILIHIVILFFKIILLNLNSPLSLGCGGGQRR